MGDTRNGGDWNLDSEPGERDWLSLLLLPFLIGSAGEFPSIWSTKTERIGFTAALEVRNILFWNEH